MTQLYQSRDRTNDELPYYTTNLCRAADLQNLARAERVCGRLLKSTNRKDGYP